MDFYTRDKKVHTSRCIDGYVDDTTGGVNDEGTADFTSFELKNESKTMAHTWDRLLFASGGLLEREKCLLSTTLDSDRWPAHPEIARSPTVLML